MASVFITSAAGSLGHPCEGEEKQVEGMHLAVGDSLHSPGNGGTVAAPSSPPTAQGSQTKGRSETPPQTEPSLPGRQPAASIPICGKRRNLPIGRLS
jgi:hypothetical protein